jgi:hypothetical protein
MFRLYEHIERALARWASRKYKSLSRRRQGGRPVCQYAVAAQDEEWPTRKMFQCFTTGG